MIVLNMILVHLSVCNLKGFVLFADTSSDRVTIFSVLIINSSSRSGLKFIKTNTRFVYKRLISDALKNDKIISSKLGEQLERYVLLL